MSKFSDLEGLTITRIEGAQRDSGVILFTASDRLFRMCHHQDCCEHVVVESVTGNLADMLGEKVINAVENSNSDEAPRSLGDESYTWTTYTIRTQSATVVIRWYGVSNGCYSEAVDFQEIKA